MRPTVRTLCTIVVSATLLGGCQSFWAGLSRPAPIPRDGRLTAADPGLLDRPGAEALDAYLKGKAPPRPLYDGGSATAPVECFDAPFGGSPDVSPTIRQIPAACAPGRLGFAWDEPPKRRAAPFAWVEAVYPDVSVQPRETPPEPW